MALGSRPIRTTSKCPAGRRTCFDDKGHLLFLSICPRFGPFLPWQPRHGASLSRHVTPLMDIWATYQAILADEEVRRRRPSLSTTHSPRRYPRPWRPFSLSQSSSADPMVFFSDMASPFLPSFSDLKRELVKQGQKYAEEALTYRDKIALLALGFIKDDSVVRAPRVVLPSRLS